MVALETLPKNLNETYERILKKIMGKGERVATVAQKVLMWLVGSIRPLSLLELQEAIMIECGASHFNEKLRLLDTADILTTCGSLVEAFSNEENSQCVRLSHYTVQVGIGRLSS